MRRRALLVSLGSLTTGCLSAPPGNPSANSPSDSSPSMTTSDAEYQITRLSVTTSTDQPSVKYVLKPMAFYSADAVEREREESTEEIVVMDVSRIDDPAIRQAIETALRDEEWRSNTLPEGLTDLVKRVDFFTGSPVGDTYTHVGLELYRLHPGRPPAIEFDASVPDEQVSPESPGTLEFTLRNTGKETQEVFSGTVPPFGIVRAKRTTRGGEFLLWRNYEEDGCVTFTDDGMAVCSIGKITELAPDEELARRYNILPSTTEHYPDRTVPPGPGAYLMSDTLGYSTGNGAPGSKLTFAVNFTLDRSS